MLFSMLMAAGLACSELPGMADDFESETISFEAVETLAASEPDCTRAHVVLGRLAMKRATIGGEEGMIDKGVAAFREAVGTAPEASMAHTWLGRALLSRAGRNSSLSDASEAIESLETAIELDPMNFDARETLAAFHRAAPWIAGGDMDVAEEQAEFIMQHDRRLGIEMTARNLMADGDEDEAIELMHATLRENPGWDELVVQLAVAWHNEEEFEKAHGLLSEYAAKPEPAPRVVYQLGRTSALSGRFIEDGRKAMHRYIAMVETDDSPAIPVTSALWRLGHIEEHAGNVDAARAAYEKALALDPEYEQAKEALDDLD